MGLKMSNEASKNKISTYVAPPYNVLEEQDILPLIKAIRKEVLKDPKAQKIYLAMSNDIAQKGTSSVFYPQVEKAGDEDFYLKQAKIVEDKAPIISQNLQTLGIDAKAAATAPSYYRDYGDYYLKRFVELQAGSALNPSKLSIPGMIFRNNTLKALQEGFVMLAKEDPALFQTMQHFKQDDFLQYAFDAHPIAYQKSGIHGISKGDHLTIFRIGNAKGELFTKKGFKQVATILSAHLTKHIDECVKGFADTISHSTEPMKHQHIRFIKKYVEALANQKSNADLKPQEVRKYLHQVFALASANNKSSKYYGADPDSKLSKMVNQSILGKSRNNR